MSWANESRNTPKIKSLFFHHCREYLQRIAVQEIISNRSAEKGVFYFAYLFVDMFVRWW